jgi:hypothetical protein
MSTDSKNDWLDVADLGVTWLAPSETTPSRAAARVFRWRLLPSDKGWALTFRVAVPGGADSHDKH